MKTKGHQRGPTSTRQVLTEMVVYNSELSDKGELHLNYLFSHSIRLFPTNKYFDPKKKLLKKICVN